MTYYFLSVSKDYYGIIYDADRKPGFLTYKLRITISLASLNYYKIGRRNKTTEDIF